MLHHRALDDILKALVELLIDGTLAITDFERPCRTGDGPLMPGLKCERQERFHMAKPHLALASPVPEK